MNINDLKKVSISNLNLIILNNSECDLLRKFANEELKKRIKNFGCSYNDILHMDDNVIKKRGINIQDYLISPNVDMQKLMEIFFMYDNINYKDNYLLFSEKHLCNTANFNSSFFDKICSEEIYNINKRINDENASSNREILKEFKTLLEDRISRIEKHRRSVSIEDSLDILYYNETMYQIRDKKSTSHKLMLNYSDNELYELFTTKHGVLKLRAMNEINDKIFINNYVQYLWETKFVKKDSFKLKEQKRKLMHEVKSGFVVDYETENMKKVLKK